MIPVIPVFIASPSDVARERDMTEAAVQALAPRLQRLFGVTLVPLRWERFAPISAHDRSHPQVGILQRIEPFSIFVGIFWKRYGTRVGKGLPGGSEMEFARALRQRDRVSILTYFRAVSKNTPRDETAQTQRKELKNLKERLRDQHVHWVPYKRPQDFGDRISGDLMEAALKLILSGEPRKTADLLEFFKFGSHHRLRSYPILIVYPPMTDPGPGHEKPVFNWRDRLLPHVIYEDSKAIQDVEETMRLIGREYKTLTTDSPDVDGAPAGDRVWVCLPRNWRANEVLDRLGDRVRFRFDSVAGSKKRPELVLRWRHRDGGWIKIRSPLRRYLDSSSRPDEAVPWSPLYGYVYAKDYAVFARFRVPRSWDVEESGEYFYHYFVGGIRGLGTWGVGHLIDHESSNLLAMAEAAMARLPRDPEPPDEESFGPVAGPGVLESVPRDDVQLLLEVTYENFRITGVRDVSEKPQSYFANRFKQSFIARRLAKRPHWQPDVSAGRVSNGRPRRKQATRSVRRGGRGSTGTGKRGAAPSARPGRT